MNSYQLPTRTENVSFYLYANVHVWRNETGREHLCITILHKLYTFLKNALKRWRRAQLKKKTNFKQTNKKQLGGIITIMLRENKKNDTTCFPISLLS